MAIQANIRVSFATNPQANNQAQEALQQNGPFAKRPNAPSYWCDNVPDAAVGAALQQLGNILQQHANSIDFVSISLIKTDPTPQAAEDAP